ncbi:MAG: PepSY domain-containing protein [Candidatus Thiodiazotropha sp. (ex Gloverina cf. vestifex)]|nr:PepSY domain-containing protein [Candidatus Thiodiazotropha sp. (ex Gloverina cf. vestifex)]
MKRTATVIFSLGLLLVSVVLADDNYLEARRLVAGGKIQPLEAILEQVQTVQPGSVLEVELEEDDDRMIYEIELLDKEGMVWEIKIDAVTGELVERELED